MPDSWDLPDGQTHALPFCDACPAVWTWPPKNLIQGVCPRCGRDHPQAWRFAAARRILLRRERERVPALPPELS